LLAWKSRESFGGLQDSCGWFSTPQMALEFFRNSKHCEDFNCYQIINGVTWDVVSEKIW
jgi:hypothetical protein